MLEFANGSSTQFLLLPTTDPPPLDMKLLPKQLFREKYFGLSLSYSAVRALAVTSNKQIQSSTQVDLPAQVFSPQTINKDQLTSALKSIITSGNFSSPYAAVCIPEYYSFTRSYTIPKIPLEEVREALTWQLEKIFPLPKKEIYIDWKLISETPTHLNLLVIAMPKRTLDELILVFESAGLLPVSFQTSASALTRIIDLPDNSTSILVEINPTGSSATLIENKISTLTITSQFDSGIGGQNVKNALQKTSQSIQSLINFHSNKFSTDTTSIGIVLTGDSASSELATWLTNYLNRSVTLLEIPGVPIPFHLAYAAALTNVLPQEYGQSINLLPDPLEETYTATRNHKNLTARLRLALFITLISSGLAMSSLFFLLLQQRLAQSQLEQLQLNNSQQTYDAQEVAVLNQTSNAIITLFPKKTTPVNAIEQLFRLRPESITFTQITFEADKQKFLISGTALDRESLLLLKQRMEDSSVFENPTIPLGSLEKPNNINFSLSVGISSTNK